MKLIQIFLISAGLFLTTACTHSIHLVHVSEFSPKSKPLSAGRVIKAEAQQSVVMGFAFETEYVNQAYNILMSQCPQKNIQGIVADYSTDHGFFSWTNVIRLQGLCVN